MANRFLNFSKYIAPVGLVLAIVFWASAYVGIRYAVVYLSPGVLGLLRYAVAAVVMGIVYLNLKEKTKFNLKEGLFIFFAGAVGIGVYNVAVNQGELTVPAGIACFIVTTMPVFASLAAVFIFKERMTKKGILGLFLSLLGVLLIAISKESLSGQNVLSNLSNIWGRDHLAGIGFLLFAVLCAVFYSLMQKKLLKKFKPTELTCLCIFSAFLIQLVFAPEAYLALKTAHVGLLVCVVFLGVFSGALAYLCFNLALSRFSVGQATTGLFAMPFFAMLLGWVVLGESVSWLGFLGGCLALSGPVLLRI